MPQTKWGERVSFADFREPYIRHIPSFPITLEAAQCSIPGIRASKKQSKYYQIFRTGTKAPS
jgi:hypothetical protein